MVFAVLTKLGKGLTSRLAAIGQLGRFVAATLREFAGAIGHPADWRQLPPQMYAIGATSVPMVALTGLFVGMAMGIGSYASFAAWGLAERTGAAINAAVVREIGPVLAATMLAGRVGGALTAELGTMRVTEQLDALRVMGVDPIRYLVVPRFASCFLLIPFLTAYVDLMGIGGGYLYVVTLRGVSAEEYNYHAFSSYVEVYDVGVGLAKSFVFGATIGLVSCYKGFHCRDGAEGVGRACTEAFVLSFGLVLGENLLLSHLAEETFVGLFGPRTFVG